MSQGCCGDNYLLNALCVTTPENIVVPVLPALTPLWLFFQLLGSWLACFTPGCWCDSRVESSFSSALCGSRSRVIDWPPPCLPVPNWVMLARLQQILCCLPSAALFLWVTSAGLGQFIACRGVASTMFLWYLVAKKKKRLNDCRTSMNSTVNKPSKKVKIIPP